MYSAFDGLLLQSTTSLKRYTASFTPSISPGVRAGIFTSVMTAPIFFDSGFVIFIPAPENRIKPQPTGRTIQETNKKGCRRKHTSEHEAIVAHRRQLPLIRANGLAAALASSPDPLSVRTEKKNDSNEDSELEFISR